MLTVQDVMTTDVVSFETDTPLVEALKQLLDERMGGAPVLDRGRVVGVLSRTDIVALSGGSAQLTAGEVMTPLVRYVRADEPAMSAVRMMLEEGIHRVIVVRGRGWLAGIVTTMDILQAVAHGGAFAAQPGDGDPRETHADAPSALQSGA